MIMSYFVFSMKIRMVFFHQKDLYDETYEDPTNDNAVTSCGVAEDYCQSQPQCG